MQLKSNLILFHCAFFRLYPSNLHISFFHFILSLLVVKIPSHSRHCSIYLPFIPNYNSPLAYQNESLLVITLLTIKFRPQLPEVFVCPVRASRGSIDPNYRGFIDWDLIHTILNQMHSSSNKAGGELELV